MEVEGGSKRKQIMKKRRDIDIEKANQLIKKSKNHSNKEAAESADKEVIVVNEKRSNDDDDDDDDDDANVAISSSSKITDDKIRLWDESVKCLFLRARSPCGEVFDEVSTGSLSQKELIDYVDEKFVQKILSRQLVAVNISELTRNGGSGNKIVDSLSL
ncbi:unnamed protein product [Rhizophagus irregularis]|nr:unnamed protein product [Rhizophagus irregularis]